MNEVLPERTPIRRVRLQLRAGISGFDLEPDLTANGSLGIPNSVLRLIRSDPSHLVAVQVRDQGMEPMLFEDDWVVIDINDTTKRSREVFAVNWNGEACIASLIERGGQWYLSYVNPDFKPINVRSGQIDIVGRVVYQPGRILTGRL